MVSDVRPIAGQPEKAVPALVRQRRWWVVLLLLWGVAVWTAWVTHIADIRAQSIQVATEGARNMFRMVVLTRSWNSSHGGVYVPVTPQTQPNPYLDVARRDVTTTDGQALTLINPAYMTRLIAEKAESDSGAIFRLTSLRPIRPLNAPDDWERSALLTFEQGSKEATAVTQGASGAQLRYMAPLPVQASCLPCHARQGYKVGDVRGGISVSQRYAPIEAATTAGVLQSQWTYGAVFVLIAAMGWLLLELLRRRWLDLDGKIYELQHTREELVQSEKMASLGRMVAGFAHEINTPVGVAVGAVSHNEVALNRISAMLSQEEVSEESLREELADLQQSSALAMANLRRAASLVQSFKRTSIDQTSEQVRVFEMKELISDVLFALQGTLKRLPITVSVDCPDAMPLKGVPGLIEQLLTNLMMNAVQHAFCDGQRSGSIHIRARREGANVHLEFVDDGVGMEAVQIARVFEPFYTTRRGQGGSGLGLYICYSIVTARLGGTIECHGQPQAGCRFDVRFPAERTNKEEEATP
jgi:signal transduction histidine kinase